MSDIPDALRQLVAVRAGMRCEYCRLPQAYSYYRHHIDHIIALKHKGMTIAENLALACADCNMAKGTDVASYDETGILTPYFNPRNDAFLFNQTR